MSALSEVASDTSPGPTKTAADGEILVNVTDPNAADWTPQEEAAVKRKVDFILLPLLGLAFFALQLDRGNMANALTSTITTDLGVTTDQINVGTALMSAGIVLLEIPSNVMLQRLGPTRWLTGQIIAWGLVATFQNFITTYAGYLVTRIVLGLCESGFIPGALYTMSTWYKKDESALRISIFFLGNLLASAITSLIGAAILTMGDRYGVAGWRWLFIIEGLITVGVGIVFLFLLPPAVGRGSPFVSFGQWSYFSERESHILVRRVLLDDPAKSPQNRMRITGGDVWRTVRNPRILTHFVVSLTATIPVSAIQTYGASVIKSLGYGTVRANAMASVGNFIAIVVVVALGWGCDRTRKRSPFLLTDAVWSLIAYACLRNSSSWSDGMRYAAVTFSLATNSIVHILNVGWLSANCRTPQERSVAMAMIIMAANIAAICGSQVFRTGDAPLYVNAFTACLTLSALVVAEVAALGGWYVVSNKKLEKRGGEVVKGETDETADGHREELVARWWWTW